jgi:hypothetical protein
VTNEILSLHDLSITELKNRFLDTDAFISESLLSALEKDPRNGVQNLAFSLRKRHQRNLQEEQRLEKLLSFERGLWAE